MSPAPRSRLVRYGVTLIELLVVVSIMLILTVIAVPMMKPAMESRQIREAARATNVYFGSARNHAMETGRPCGVCLERDPRFLGATTVLRQFEVPSPYAGEFQNSRIRLVPIPNTNKCSVSFLPTGQLNPALMTPPMILPGDSIQLNYQGHIWTVNDISADGATWEFLSPTTAYPPNCPGGLELPFQVFRQPVPSAIAPLTLPA